MTEVNDLIVSLVYCFTFAYVMLSLMLVPEKLYERMSRGVAINSGLVGGWRQVQIGTFLYHRYNGGIKESIQTFLHHVNNIEPNFKKNIYTSIEGISLIHP